MLAIKSNAACLDSCHWLNPTAIKSNVPFKLLRSIRPEIFISDFIVRAFSIAVGFNQRATVAINQMFLFKLLLSIRPEIFNSDFIVRAFSLAVGFNQRPTAAIKLNVACLDSGLSKKYGWS